MELRVGRRGPIHRQESVGLSLKLLKVGSSIAEFHEATFASQPRPLHTQLYSLQSLNPKPHNHLINKKTYNQ